MYNADGTTEKVRTDIALGDWHSGQTDPIVKNNFIKLCHDLNIHDTFVHDFKDGKSISHHDLGFPLKMAKKAMQNKLSLEDELVMGGQDINWFHVI